MSSISSIQNSSIVNSSNGSSSGSNNNSSSSSSSSNISHHRRPHSSSSSSSSSSPRIGHHHHQHLRPLPSPVTGSQQSSQGANTTIMKAETSNAKVVQQILQCMHFKSKDQWIVWEMSPSGIKIISEDNRCFQAQTMLRFNLFNMFLFTAQNRVLISLPLGQLLNNINTFAANLEATTMKIQYPGVENTVHVIMTQGDSVMQFSVKTRPPEDPTSFPFRAYPTQNRIIIKSPILRYHLADFEHFDDKVQVSVIDDALCFFSGGGGFQGGECEVRIPKDSSSVLNFTSQASQTFRFKLDYIMAFCKSLSVPERTCIRINERGMINMQNAIKIDDNSIFIDFTIMPEDDQVEGLDDDDDDDSMI